MVKIRICPKCKEPKLKSAMNVSGWLAPNMFECTNCGYLGYFHIEIDSEDFQLDEEKAANDNSES
ncbi:MAG: hypothetical protein KAX18_02475 [Candidatus Lokiarchaeota archaeon]|jgi:hypothetical protein|nr:hypothetical protein [Candidatus Lokiarchaeota archaeon]